MTVHLTKHEREQFLAGVHVGVVGISEPGGNLWFEIRPDSRKGRLLEVGSRISLCAQDERPPYAYVSVEGPVIEIAEDNRELHEISMEIRYLGEQGERDYIDNFSIGGLWKRYIMRLSAG